MMKLNRTPAEWLAHIKERGSDKTDLIIREHVERYDSMDTAGSFYLKESARFKAAKLDSGHVSTMLIDMKMSLGGYYLAITLDEGITYFKLRPSHVKVDGVQVSMLRLIGALISEEETDGSEHCMVVRTNLHGLILVMGHLYPMVSWLIDQNLMRGIFENELVNLLWEYTDAPELEEDTQVS